MKNVFLRAFFISLALLVGFTSIGCDEDDDVNLPAVNLPAAPREPVAAPTATAVPPVASPTPGNGEPREGESVGFLGRIREIRAFRMTIGDVEEVVFSGDTQLRRNGRAATFSEFSVGENVRVAGVVLGDGAILATRMTLIP